MTVIVGAHAGDGVVNAVGVIMSGIVTVVVGICIGMGGVVVVVVGIGIGMGGVVGGRCAWCC